MKEWVELNNSRKDENMKGIYKDWTIKIEDSSPILGICIPTYNRASILRNNLIRVIKVVERYKLPIYISDNCSTDNTTEVVFEMKTLYKNIVYSKNKENLGVDRNFEKVLKLCDEPYAWLLGDDDTIDSDIKIIMEILADKKPDILMLGEDDRIKSGIYEDKLWILNKLGLQMTWMSGNLISREIINDADFERYYDTQFIHAGIILDYIGRRGGRIYYIYNRHVDRMRPRHVAYDDKILEIYAKGWTELLMRLPGFSYQEKLYQCVIRTKQTGMLNNKILLSLRSQGYLNLNDLNKYGNYIRLYNKSPYLVLYLICIFPISVARFLRKLYKLWQIRLRNV